MLSLYPLLLTVGIGTAAETPISTAPTLEPRYFDAVEGTWDGQFRPSVVFLHMKVEREKEKNFTSYGRAYALGELVGLRREKKTVGFELRRNAGTFRFDGAATDLKASGTFEFIPSPAFKKQLDKMGYRKLTRHNQLTFALHDVTASELRFLQRAIKGRTTTSDMVRLVERGATPEYIRDLISVGYLQLTTDMILRTRDAGVNADYIRALRAAGLRLTLDQFIAARRQGLAAEYVTDLKEVGITNLTVAEYLNLKEHDVTAAYASSIYEAGYGSCDLDDLVRLRDHGITATFIKKANKQAGEALTVAELLRVRTRGEY
jgi:hypothetical protein